MVQVSLYLMLWTILCQFPKKVVTTLANQH